MESNETIRIAAAIITRSDGKTLLVRKRGTAAFMQPGGKIEAAEQPAAALCRELFEELGLSIGPTQAAYLGRYSAMAANEPGGSWKPKSSVSPYRLRSPRPPKSKKSPGSIPPIRVAEFWRRLRANASCHC